MWVLLPDLSMASRDPLADAMHAADRTVGIGRAWTDEGPRLIVMTRHRQAEAARQHAIDLIKRSASAAGVDEQSVVTLRVLDVQARRVPPGRPRPHGALPPEAKTIRLADGRVLRAAYEGPLGEWIVGVEGGSEVWRGRWLLAVLSELFQLPHGRKEPWVYDVIRELAGRETAEGVRYQCPCCDCWTLEEPPTGTHAGCPVCRWEDDSVQYEDPSYKPGANRTSLLEARRNYAEFGSSEGRRSEWSRAPEDYERP